MKKITSLILAMALCISLCACAETTATEQVPQQVTENPEALATFQESMEAMMTAPGPNNVTGDKAVTMVYDNGGRFGWFTDEHLPDSLRTRDVAQVRYVIRRVEDVEYVGYYSNNVAALQQVYTVEVLDLQRNLILDTREFLGGDPPSTLKEGQTGGNIGSAPNEEDICAWILDVIGRGPSEDAQKIFITIRVQVPEEWGTPYLNFFNSYDPATQEYGAIDFFREMTQNGQWYSIVLPGWIEDIYVSTVPESLGSDNWHSTDVFGRRDAEGKDIWISVLDMEGNISWANQEP